MQRVQARDGPSSGAVVVFLSPPPPQKNQSTGPKLETGWPWVRGAVLRELLFQFLPLIMCTPSYTHTHTHTLAGTVYTDTHTRAHRLVVPTVFPWPEGRHGPVGLFQKPGPGITAQAVWPGLGYKSGSPTPGSDLRPQGGTQGDWEVGVGVTWGEPSWHLLRRS